MQKGPCFRNRSSEADTRKNFASQNSKLCDMEYLFMNWWLIGYWFMEGLTILVQLSKLCSIRCLVDLLMMNLKTSAICYRRISRVTEIGITSFKTNMSMSV